MENSITILKPYRDNRDDVVCPYSMEDEVCHNNPVCPTTSECMWCEDRETRLWLYFSD